MGFQKPRRKKEKKKITKQKELGELGSLDNKKEKSQFLCLGSTTRSFRRDGKTPPFFFLVNYKKTPPHFPNKYVKRTRHLNDGLVKPKSGFFERRLFLAISLFIFSNLFVASSLPSVAFIHSVFVFFFFFSIDLDFAIFLHRRRDQEQERERCIISLVWHLSPLPSL